MKNDNFYITTPIYYVNDKPHIGHAYTTILADVLARYHRLINVPTWFLTGTDEHGQKVQRAAEAAGMTPQQQADDTVGRFQALWQKLEVTNDDFIRTTEPRHQVVVQKILQELFDRDEIYRDEFEGWYCVTCERFYTEKDLVEGNCPEPGCGRAVERITEPNYFFRMSKYQQWLIDYIEANPTFIQPDFRRNETLGFLRKELTDLCISRPKSRMGWGIELPFDADFVTYVWFDALVNYISAAGYLSDDEQFASLWPATYHLIGKDILTTHTVYWPTMLKAMGLPMPQTVFAHGWWLVGRDKMSKTAGNVVNPMEFADQYGVDAFRYFLMAEMSLGQDASFTEEAFIRRYNTDLANDLGNMLSRVTKLIGSYFDGVIPTPQEPGEAEALLRDTTLKAAEALVSSVERMRPDQGLHGLSAVVREANRYMEVRQPWTLAKDEATHADAGTVLYYAAEALRIVSGMLYPVMPGKMSELRSALGLLPGAPVFADLHEWGLLKPGAPIQKMKILFPRIQVPKSNDKAAVATDKPKAKPAAKPAPQGVSMIEFTDFTKVKLRTARVLEAEKVEGADKLLRLQIDLGEEQRQIVAGVALHYAPEALVGKTIVVVANLKPATIRKVDSNGMLLAASSGDQLRLITVDGDMPAGSSVG
ncbi:MAG: methionine--tRNA ligase [Verrucomicrobia bacterium]|jgi:methionyl-tRNA synthetase|nr:methionine--tRNA ligase [Verrucomicrobiota bacterium]MBT7068384.1 methionine--tRNA ligase [Verrucomicrobiota bacterium]